MKEEITIILWAMGLGFTGIGGLMIYLHSSLSNGLNTRIDKLDEKLSSRIDKLDEKVTDIDRRLCRMEGAFSRQECCVIHQKNHDRKAE